MIKTNNFLALIIFQILFLFPLILIICGLQIGISSLVKYKGSLDKKNKTKGIIFISFTIYNILSYLFIAAVLLRNIDGENILKTISGVLYAIYPLELLALFIYKITNLFIKYKEVKEKCNTLETKKKLKLLLVLLITAVVLMLFILLLVILSIVTYKLL